jgi:Flp pilus assembly protein TadD
VARPLAAAGFGDRVIDLRVDDSKAPLVELRRLLNMFRSRALVGEANSRLNAGNLTEASQAAQNARDKSPEFDEAWVIWGATELRAGRKASALDALRKAVELNPANKRWLLRNRHLEPLFNDAEFKRIIGTP